MSRMKKDDIIGCVVLGCILLGLGLFFNWVIRYEITDYRVERYARELDGQTDDRGYYIQATEHPNDAWGDPLIVEYSANYTEGSDKAPVEQLLVYSVNGPKEIETNLVARYVVEGMGKSAGKAFVRGMKGFVAGMFEEEEAIKKEK